MTTHLKAHVRRTFLTPVIAAMTIGVSGCGGGGGDGNSAASKAPVAQPRFTMTQGQLTTISADNFRLVASELATSYKNVAVYSEVWDLRILASTLFPSGLKEGAVNASRNCGVKGTEALHGNRRLAPAQDSPGDWYEDVYTNCKDTADAAEPEVTGSRSYEMTQSSTGDFWTSGVYSTGQIVRVAEMSFLTAGAPQLVLNSEMHVTSRSNADNTGSDVLSSGRLELSSTAAPPAQSTRTLVDGITAQWDLAADVWTVAMHATVSATSLGGKSFTLSTETSLQRLASEPAARSGTLLAAGLSGSKVKLVFLGSGNVRLEFYPAGSQTATVSEIHPWTDFVP